MLEDAASTPMIRAITLICTLAISASASAVYKCEAPGRAPVYQDLPCLASERMTRLDGNSVNDLAGAKAIEADRAKTIDAKQKAERSAAFAAKEAQEKAERAKAVAAALASNREWQDAKYAVRVGMTSAELDALHPRFQFGGRRRTMESASGSDEWIDFDEDHLTIRIHNGVVASIHR